MGRQFLYSSALPDPHRGHDVSRIELMQIGKTQDILSLVELWFIAIPMEFDGCFTTRRRFTSDILGSSEKQ
jgi:hypothetical protein